MFRNTRAFSSFSVDDTSEARAFYTDVLGLDVREQGDLLNLHIAEGIPVLIYPKDNHAPASHTVLNFPVDNIEQTVDALAARGVQFERYEGFSQDDKGIFRIEGVQQAWFKDPAGNILSVIQEG
jgi:catechol 2,3-dioxygenase-like lactoylglutathione lyase family enzyme